MNESVEIVELPIIANVQSLVKIGDIPGRIAALLVIQSDNIEME